MNTKLVIFFVLLTGLQYGSKAQSSNKPMPLKKEILLIGTFHFNNPNADAVKTVDFDITTPASQKELEMISTKIKAFNPDKIFVEWEYNDQQQLDSLYQLYLNDQYEKHIDQTYKNKRNYRFYAQNEIFQLAFRAGKKAGLTQINGVDYPLDLPVDTVMKAIQEAGQDQLMQTIQNTTSAMEKEANQKRRTMNLTQLILDANTTAFRRSNYGFYVSTLNRAGKDDNFAGALSVSEWYRRNLYMYALVQKLTKATDQKIVLLLGAGHISMIRQFIDGDDQFKITELKEIIK
ncbi:DUF5694 domain-containing protein [Pedobacter metabolipauper]|uniref:TraB family protein n=1 Tax=Pedobacter metabolipauper TaxID=425513 RepID=A0A4R6SXU0_9SPHI|nr:DUF5694 domain-containing protein [Pedobacter metabolipauper]TDQ10033.1 hypothetical protein ATK78_2192 [Pedobacter metabolipauper]